LIKDAPILILDEPTANLDPFTEQQILETLFKVMKQKTSLLITHRLIGLENVNEILVMNHGQIIERGSHAELAGQDTFYRRLLDLQNRILADDISKCLLAWLAWKCYNHSVPLKFENGICHNTGCICLQLNRETLTKIPTSPKHTKEIHQPKAGTGLFHIPFPF
jgi:ABC-type sulfate/molybdate transport systems ATPase subunit